MALIPELRDPGRRDQLLAGFAKIRSGLGSIGLPIDAPRSFEHARSALRLGVEANLPGLVVADDHRSTLIARSDPLLVQEIFQSRLSALSGETANARARLLETLLAWLRSDGNIPVAAESLHVHAQTVRYRMARLRELLGDALDDPDVRFELEYALRAPGI